LAQGQSVARAGAAVSNTVIVSITVCMARHNRAEICLADLRCGSHVAIVKLPTSREQTCRLVLMYSDVNDSAIIQRLNGVAGQFEIARVRLSRL
jgi:hypothetical protein